MKTCSIRWIDPNLKAALHERMELRFRPSRVTLGATAMLAAALPALALASVSAWAVSNIDPGLFNAMLCATGLVLMAIATDIMNRRAALITGASGVVIMTTALLGYHIAIEFALLGSWIVAALTAPAVLTVIWRNLLSAVRPAQERGNRLNDSR